MEDGKIIQLEQIFGSLFQNGTKIINQTTKRLTSAGENYGSLMLALDVKVKNASDEKIVHLVVKLVPPNEMLQQFFNTPVTFPNEIGFYSTVFPTLRQFQNEQGMEEAIDYSAKYYGSRLSLNPNSRQVDSGAALILENLKTTGFINVNRLVGCDLETARLIIKNLAHLHAVPLGLKLLQPEVFNEKVKRYLLKEGLFQEELFLKKHLNLTCKLVESLEEIAPLADRVRKAIESTSFNGISREPFATICHNDCWTNNTMVKFENNRAIETKLVDFQICNYGSPANDVVFFLFSSVETQVLQKHYDDLIHLYYDTFITILKKLKCDTCDFSFDSFLDEINHEATYTQFHHVTMMLEPIFAEKGTVKEIEDLRVEDFEKTDVTEAHKKKLVFVVKEFAKRNWI